MPAHLEPELSSETVVLFLSSLWQMNRRIKQDIEPRLAQRQLDMRRFFILSAIRRGTVYPKELSEKLGLPATLLSRYLEQLVQLGFLERQIDRQDSRRTRLSLTESGTQAVDAAAEDIKTYTSQRLQRLDPSRLGLLLESMERLGHPDLER